MVKMSTGVYFNKCVDHMEIYKNFLILKRAENNSLVKSICKAFKDVYYERVLVGYDYDDREYIIIDNSALNGTTIEVNLMKCSEKYINEYEQALDKLGVFGKVETDWKVVLSPVDKSPSIKFLNVKARENFFKIMRLYNLDESD